MKTPADILDRARSAARKAFYHLAPRYTSGSPAMVDVSEACRVADHEREAYANHLSGVFGDENRVRAKSKGLGGIAYARWERGGKVWRLDLLTGVETIELPRLSWDERERVKELRAYPLDADKTTELAALESRLEIHRETV